MKAGDVERFVVVLRPEVSAEDGQAAKTVPEGGVLVAGGTTGGAEHKIGSLPCHFHAMGGGAEGSACVVG